MKNKNKLSTRTEPQRGEVRLKPLLAILKSLQGIMSILWFASGIINLLGKNWAATVASSACIYYIIAWWHSENC